MSVRRRLGGSLSDVVEAVDAAVEEQTPSGAAELQLHPATRAVAAGREIAQRDTLERLPGEPNRKGPARGDPLLAQLEDRKSVV